MRIKKVQKALSKWDVEAYIVKDPIDLFYLTGIEMSAGTCLITKTDATLFVDNRYYERCKNDAPMKVEKLSALGKRLKKCTSIGFCSNALTYLQFEAIQDETKAELVPIEEGMQTIRAVKDAKEVKALEKAIKLCYRGLDFVKDRLRTGVKEITLAKELEIFWLSNGGEKLSFEPIIAFGKNSSMPHYRSSDVALKPGDVVLVDIGVVVNGYASDMTRMFFFGKPDPRIEKIYDIVLESQVKSIKAIKPNCTAESVYNVSNRVIDRAGYADKYLHGLGHGIGLETHEYPYLRPSVKAKLLPGTCVTVEPGIYLPKVGGVRIEDMVLVTKDGNRVLTSEYPKTKTIIKSE